MLLVIKELRQRMEINNTAELVVGQEGSPLFLVTKDKNQFLQHRELFLGFNQDMFPRPRLSCWYISFSTHHPASSGFHLEVENGGVARMLSCLSRPYLSGIKHLFHLIIPTCVHLILPTYVDLIIRTYAYQMGTN